MGYEFLYVAMLINTRPKKYHTLLCNWLLMNKPSIFHLTTFEYVTYVLNCPTKWSMISP